MKKHYQIHMHLAQENITSHTLEDFSAHGIAIDAIPRAQVCHLNLNPPWALWALGFCSPSPRERIPLGGSLFSTGLYKSLCAVECITRTRAGTIELPLMQPVALTRGSIVSSRRSHLHAEDAPTRF